MLLRVAGDAPYRVFTLMDEPLWRVLYVFHHLQEHDERAALNDRLARVDHGFLTNFAMTQPDSLTEELQRVQAAIARLDQGPGVDAAHEWADARAKAEAMLARMERGRVLSPDALVS